MTGRVGDEMFPAGQQAGLKGFQTSPPPLGKDSARIGPALKGFRRPYESDSCKPQGINELLRALKAAGQVVGFKVNGRRAFRAATLRP